MARGALLVTLALVAAAALADGAPAPIRATTASGDAVWLHASGRWEYVDPAKAAAAERVAAQQPDRLRRADAQGGLFGIGREILPGDPDYNRGSRNPKFR